MYERRSQEPGKKPGNPPEKENIHLPDYKRTQVKQVPRPVAGWSRKGRRLFITAVISKQLTLLTGAC